MTKRTNDYFLDFGVNSRKGDLSSPLVEQVKHPDIPSGYALFLYKREVYIPTRVRGISSTDDPKEIEYIPSYRGSGSNPYTRDVPIHYSGQGALQRAIAYLKESARTDTEKEQRP